MEPRLKDPPPAVKLALQASTKAQHASRPIMAIVFCLSALYICFGILSISFFGLQTVASGQLHRAKLYHGALLDNTARENLTLQRLETLRESKLGRRFFEVHTDCLARGINHADAHFLGRDYTEYPTIRNSTISWVKENCDRLFFTPETYHHPSPQETEQRSTTWAVVSRRARIIVDRFKSLWPWGTYVSARNTTTRNDTSSDKASTAPTPGKHIYLPRHFRLTGCNVPPCELVYLPPKDAPVAPVSPQKALDVAARRVASLNTIIARLSQIHHILETTSSTFWIVQFVTAFLFMINVSFLAYIKQLGSFDKCFYAQMALQGGVELLLLVLARPGLSMPAEVYFALFFLGFAGFATFFVPNDILPNVSLLFAAAKELVGVISGRSIRTPSSLESLGLTPSPKSAVRRIAPETTLKEDLSITMEALRTGAQYSGSEDEGVGNEVSGAVEGEDAASDSGSDWSVVSGEWTA